MAKRTGIESRQDAAILESVRGLARAARVLERASGELSMAQYRVLASVAAGEDRASRVAERLELGRSAVSSAVESLCARGLMEQLEAQGDQRAFDLHVSDQGLALLKRIERNMSRVLRDLCSRVDDADQLLVSLGNLGGAVDSYFAARRASQKRNSR